MKDYLTKEIQITFQILEIIHTSIGPAVNAKVYYPDNNGKAKVDQVRLHEGDQFSLIRTLTIKKEDFKNW